MADLFKTATGSVGPDGQAIYDVFEGDRKLELPEFQQRGLNIDQIQIGQAPTGFTSQFNPVVIPPFTAPKMEGALGSTPADTKALYDSKIATIEKGYRDQIAAMAPTQGELDRRNRLTNLQEAQTRSIEDVENRSLDGAILRSGAESEIANIQAGRTFASLPNIREQRLLTLQLGNDLAQRQIKVDQAKVAIEAGEADYKMFQDYQDTVRDFDEKTQERNDTLPTRQKELVESIVTQYAGLEWNDLDPQTQKTLTDLAGKFGVTTQAIQVNLQNAKNQISLDNTKAKLENQRIQADIAKTSGSGDGNDQLYTGLSSSTSTAVRAKVAKFSTEPLIQNFGTIQDGYNFASSLSDTTKNPADDQALIYSLAKALDPGSVVREGEYATAQKYAQSWVNAYGKQVTQAIAGTGFLSETARKNIKATIKQKYDSSKISYDNLNKQYKSGINNLTGRKDGENFLIDYVTSQKNDEVDSYLDSINENLKLDSIDSYLSNLG